ncbi:MAG: hypothetical protein ACRC5H_05295 [Treponemataceae bacterium]
MSCVSKNMEEITIVGQIIVVGNVPFTHPVIKTEKNNESIYFTIEPSNLESIFIQEQGHTIEFTGVILDGTESQFDKNNKIFSVKNWKRL